MHSSEGVRYGHPPSTSSLCSSLTICVRSLGHLLGAMLTPLWSTGTCFKVWSHQMTTLRQPFRSFICAINILSTQPLNIPESTAHLIMGMLCWATSDSLDALPNISCAPATSTPLQKSSQCTCSVNIPRLHRFRNQELIFTSVWDFHRLLRTG